MIYCSKTHRTIPSAEALEYSKPVNVKVSQDTGFLRGGGYKKGRRQAWSASNVLPDLTGRVHFVKMHQDEYLCTFYTLCLNVLIESIS